jgi:hypothetical protein
MMSGLTLFQAGVVQAHGLQSVRRQIGHHHIGRGHQAADNLAAFRMHRVERHAALVAARLHEQSPVTLRRDGRQVAVLAALHALDADHIGAQIRQQRGAERAGDIAPEIQHPNSFQHLAHSAFPPGCVARRRRDSSMALPSGRRRSRMNAVTFPQHWADGKKIL